MSEGKLILTCGHTNMPLVGVWEPETDERGNRCRSYSTYCPACAEEATRVMVGRIEELEAKLAVALESIPLDTASTAPFAHNWKDRRQP